MKLNLFALAAVALAPGLAVAQGKAPHPAPRIVMGKSATVRKDDRPDKIADKADRAADRTSDKTARTADKAEDKAAHNADKSADKTERASEKTERADLEAAHEQKLLTKGIKLTSAEKKQLKAIEKKYDSQIRSLRKSEVVADKTAKKNGTADSDASFAAQLSQLQVQERSEMRAVLTPQQQSIFDTNVAKASSHK